MKKLLSISLITLILLNTIGYYAVFVGLQFQYDQAIVQRLDENQYDESNTVTLKIPVAIPYMQGQEEFERMDGTFSYAGDYYRIVKQKYADDTLTIICYKDREAKVIQNALTDYVKTFTDNPQPGNNAKIAVAFIKDFIGTQFEITNTSKGWQLQRIDTPCTITLQDSFSITINHPPEIA